jgi:hypothetical protein
LTWGWCAVVHRIRNPAGERIPPGFAKGNDMKYAGLLVMPAGFFLTLSALVLFPASSPGVRAGFVLCGLAVEALGLVVAVRGHMEAEAKNRQ